MANSPSSGAVSNHKTDSSEVTINSTYGHVCAAHKSHTIHCTLPASAIFGGTDMNSIPPYMCGCIWMGGGGGGGGGRCKPLSYKVPFSARHPII